MEPDPEIGIGASVRSNNSLTPSADLVIASAGTVADGPSAKTVVDVLSNTGADGTPASTGVDDSTAGTGVDGPAASTGSDGTKAQLATAGIGTDGGPPANVGTNGGLPADVGTNGGVPPPTGAISGLPSTGANNGGTTNNDGTPPPGTDNVGSTGTDDTFDFNAYASKKTTSQQVLSSSVFAGNFTLLASLWSTEHRPHFFVVLNVFAIISLVLTVVLASVGIRLHFLDINKNKDTQDIAKNWNEAASGVSLALLVVNTAIAAFGGTAFGVSSSSSSSSSNTTSA